MLITKRGENEYEEKLWGKALDIPAAGVYIASYDEAGVPDVMNAAWGGISEDTRLSMCLSAGHKILARGAFTVSMADAAHVAACGLV